MAKSLNTTKANSKAAGIPLTNRRSLHMQMAGSGQNYIPAPPPSISPLIEAAAKAPDPHAEAPFVLELFLVLTGRVAHSFQRTENSRP